MPSYRLALAAALGTAVLLVWIIGAVGLIGAEGDPFDRVYTAVLGVGVTGAILGRFRPAGMARALLATALAQAVVTVIALIAGKHQSPVSSVAEITLLNGFFVVLWAGSAWLFRRVASARRLAAPEA